MNKKTDMLSEVWFITTLKKVQFKILKFHKKSNIFQKCKYFSKVVTEIKLTFKIA